MNHTLRKKSPGRKDSQRGIPNLCRCEGRTRSEAWADRPCVCLRALFTGELMNPIRVTHEVNDSVSVRWHLPELPWHTPFVDALTYRYTAGLRPYLHPVYAPGGGPC